MPSPAAALETASQDAVASRWASVAICFLLLALVFGVFGQTIGHDFVNYDDNPYVTDNATVQQGLTWEGVRYAFTKVHSSNWHPLTTLSHMLDCELYGLDPWGHHLTNVLLHGATVLLIFAALRRLTGSVWRSAVVAALFAIHPLRVESVAWIAERKDVLSGFFFALSLLVYARYCRERSRGRYVTLLVAVACGMMSKPMLVTLPFVLLLLDYWPLQRAPDLGFRSFSKLLLEKIPLFAMSVGSCLATVLAQDRAIAELQYLPFGTRVANAAVSYAAYLKQLVWPSGLAPFYPHPGENLVWWHVALSAVFLAAVTALVFAARRPYRYGLIGWLWYLGMLVPVIGLMQVGSQAMADRYTYLPQIGILILVTWAIADAVGRWQAGRRMATSAAVLAILIFAALAWKQTTYWHDSEALWKRTLAVTENNQVANNGIAFFYMNTNRTQEAIPHLREALRIQPDYVDAAGNLGMALSNVGELEQAIALLQQVQKAAPENKKVPLGLGNALVLANRHEEAVGHFRHLTEVQPENAAVRFKLGDALAALGRIEEAKVALQHALRLQPNLLEAHLALASVFIGNGEVEAGVAQLREALKLHPESVDAHYNLGVALVLARQFREAVEHWLAAYRLNPELPNLRQNLTWMLATHPDPAVRNGPLSKQLGSELLRQDPQNPMAYRAAAAAFAESGAFERAREVAEQGRELARARGQTNLVSTLESDLANYQARQPVRDNSFAGG